MKQDNQTIVLMHLSQLVTLALSFGSILIPLYIWMTKKEAIKDLDAHGKNILNFQFSLLIYSLICVPLVFIGVGIIGLDKVFEKNQKTLKWKQGRAPSTERYRP